MLPKGFLGTLAEYVAGRIDRDRAALASAERAFRLPALLNKRDAEPERIAALFSEWLTFDHRLEIFGGNTGITYFAEQNPLGLPEPDISAYRDLLNFEVGLFEVRGIEAGRGVTLESIAGGKARFVNDVNASRSLAANETVWARIAPVRGAYYMVGSSFFTLPVKIIGGMRRTMAAWEKNALDAREIAAWYCGASPDGTPSGAAPTIAGSGGAPDPGAIEREFVDALRRCGMESIVPVAAFRRWLTDEKRYDISFAPRALFGLIPEDASRDDVSALMNASVRFANAIPRKSLGGKTPDEAARERGAAGGTLLEMDTYSRDEYLDDLEQAHAYMAAGDFLASYRTFEGVVQRLLDDRMPFFGAFRIYANAAICCFEREEHGLGAELVSASLRLNPRYDFGIRTQERYLAPLRDLSSLPNPERELAAVMRDMIREDGIRRYRRTAFRRYEDFLKKIGVSLAYKTITTPTVYGPEGAQRIGRNDPCFCGSGKKYKRCHGK